VTSEDVQASAMAQNRVWNLLTSVYLRFWKLVVEIITSIEFTVITLNIHCTGQAVLESK